MTINEFMILVKQSRLAKRGGWFALVETVEGCRVEFKSYGHTYLQIFRIDGLDYAGGIGMDCKLKYFESYLRDSLLRATSPKS
jgi:hypothetical protein